MESGVFKSIKTKITLSMIIIMAISLILIGTTSASLSLRSTEATIGEVMVEMAHIGGVIIADDLKIRTTVAKEAGMNARLANPEYSLNEKEAIINEKLLQYNFLSGNIVDRNGVGLIYEDNLAGKDYFEQALFGYEIISDVTFDNKLNRYVIYLSAPLWEKGILGTQIIGVAYFAMAQEHLSQIANEIKVGDGGITYLLDKNGDVIASTDKNMVDNRRNVQKLAKTMPEFSLIAEYEAKMVAGESDYGLYTEYGVEEIMAFHPVGINGWSIAVNCVKQEFMAAEANSQRIILSISVITLIIATLIAILISSDIAKPIIIVTEFAQKIARGDLNEDVPEKYSKKEDEVGILARSINNVIYNLREVLEETESIIIATSEGDYGKMGNPEKFTGAYSQIISGLNNAQETVVNRMKWYEDMLDTIPTPISATDMDLNWTFINKTACEIVGEPRGKLIGQKSNRFNATICNTDEGGLEKLKSGEHIIGYTRQGKTLEMKSEFLKDKEGNNIGLIEIANDVTARARVEEYQKNEIKKLSKDLEKLANGDLDLSLIVDEGDEYTTAERENFNEINQNLSNAVNSISTYIMEVIEKLYLIAEGDLQNEITTEYKGEFSKIKGTLNHIISNLNTIMREILDTADIVGSASNEVANGSQVLAQATTQQASAASEISATIDIIAIQAKENASSARKANDLVNNAKITTVEGSEKIKEMLTSMNDINESSNDISKIIKTIEDIAFQTNILALNAAVEAARAGQHGKGFAVVAAEVRNLAAKSAKAAKETAGIIETTVKKAARGTDIANDTAASFEQIRKLVSDTAEVVDIISLASGNQATSIAQVSVAIEQVNTTTHTSTSTAEESAAASQSMSAQALSLKALLQRFKLADYMIEGSEREKLEQMKNIKKIDLDVDELFGKY